MAFVKSGGLAALGNLLGKLWDDAKVVQASCQVAPGDRALRERLGIVHGTVEMVLNIMGSFVDSKLVNFAPYRCATVY